MKNVTEAKLNREILIVGWLLVIVTLCVVPFYCRMVLKYQSFAAGIRGDEGYAFSRELTLDTVDILGFVIKVSPLWILGALLLGLMMVINVHKRKKLPNKPDARDGL